MQGFNMGRYHPPSTLDPTLSSSSGPPTKRARTIPSTKAPPTIRFEMPFPIWCTTCPPSSTSTLIGQGVRFNAQKTRVGNYHTTPIWSFRMKHTACGGWIEIRTDPARAEYVVAEGARRRDVGDDGVVAERVGGVVVGGAGEEAERERRRGDAFAAFEGRKEEKERVKGEGRRVEELRSRQERDWRDPDALNKRMRDRFRVGRRERDVDRRGVESLKERAGLGVEVLEGTVGDERRAGLVEFGKGGGLDVMSRPVFGEENGVRLKHGGKKGEGGKFGALQKELSGNTRVALNPFSKMPLRDGALKAGLIAGVKRREDATIAEHDEETQSLYIAPPEETTTAKAGVGGLVDYDSE